MRTLVITLTLMLLISIVAFSCSFSRKLSHFEKNVQRKTTSVNADYELTQVTKSSFDSYIKPITQLTKNKTVHSVNGIFKETNIYRAAHDLAPLNLSIELSAAAKERAQHMFNEDYFDHNSPSGDSFSLSIEMTGYDTLLTGENIALGNFADDRRLVKAWFDSPGHRKNILFSHFNEIGIATLGGVYKGSKTWISVQLFSVSTDRCDVPSEKLREKINSQKSTLENREQKLATLRDQIQKSKGSQTLLLSLRGKFEKEHKDYNALLKELNVNVETFNGEVARYNTCTRSITRDYKDLKP